jgi:hypothetical protein
MNKHLIIDCIPFEFSRVSITEALTDPSKPFLVKGVLQRAEAKNQNGRVYPFEILVRESQKYSDEFIRERRALGELDHPESSVVNLKNVSHNVVEMHWESKDLIGTVEVLPTPSGNILRKLFESNIRLGISSRGMGSVQKDVREGFDTVQDDFELIAFDFVSNPSTKGAFMYSLNEGKVKNPVTNKWEKVENIIHNILTEIG